MMMERIFTIVFFAIACGYMYLASDYKSEFSYEPLGASGLPLIIGGFSALCAVILFFTPSQKGYFIDKEKAMQVFKMICFVIAYSMLFEEIGFVLSTVLVGTAISLFLGQDLKQSIMYNGIGGVIVYIISVSYTHLTLPTKA